MTATFLPPGAYRLEATLTGWNSDGFPQLTEQEQLELPKIGAPLLRGQVPTSLRITLTR